MRKIIFETRKFFGIMGWFYKKLKLIIIILCFFTCNKAKVDVSLNLADVKLTLTIYHSLLSANGKYHSVLLPCCSYNVLTKRIF